ncbi:MAG TPA: hypothetical protein VES95_03915 [Dermatophilaceae bacterium]|nr:hypothetical protein [Dermatophilaceae bacterium]
MTRRLRLRVTTAAVAVTAAAALGGCGAQHTADTAAIVDGRRITQTEAQEAAQQINTAFQPQEPFTPANAVSLLIRAPYILDFAAANGNPQSESAARAAIPTIEEPAESTLQILRAEAATQTLDDAARVELTETFAGLDVTVNPRYGTFDPQRALVQLTPPDWIAPAP